jgi:hypothetical protein
MFGHRTDWGGHRHGSSGFSRSTIPPGLERWRGLHSKEEQRGSQQDRREKISFDPCRARKTPSVGQGISSTWVPSGFFVRLLSLLM